MRLVIVALLVCSSACADTTFLTLNCENLIDSTLPTPSFVRIPTEAVWKAKALKVAEFINQVEPTIVGLQEVESQQVVDEVKRHLRGEWHYAFVRSANNLTRQSNVISSRYPVLQDSVKDRSVYYEPFSDPVIEHNGAPTQAMSAVVDFGSYKLRVVVVHLISQLNPAYSKRRLAQANVNRMR